MKPLLLLLLCSVAVGQDKLTCKLNYPDGRVVYAPCESFAVYSGPKVEPMNVPAIKKWQAVHCIGDYSGSEYSHAKEGSVARECRDGGSMVYTCPNESWELHHNVNQTNYWCSRPPVMEKP